MNENIAKEQLGVWKEALISALSGTSANGTGTPSGAVDKAIEIADLALNAYENKVQELLYDN